MDASKYLTGIELQPLTMHVEGQDIPGYELRLRWIDVAKPDKKRTGEPLVIDEESLVSLLEQLSAQVRSIRGQEPPALAH